MKQRMFLRKREEAGDEQGRETIHSHLLRL